MEIELLKNEAFEPMDLNHELIKHPAFTFYARVKGSSMKDAGIEDGDLLVIDRSLEYKNNAIAVCWLNGGFTLKRLKISEKEIYLMPANEDFEPIKVTEDDGFQIWGLLLCNIRKTY